MFYLKQFCCLLKAKRKLLILFLYYALIVACIFFYYHKEYGAIDVKELEVIKNDPVLGLNFFYTLQQPGMTLIKFLLTCLLIPNIISADFLVLKHNHFTDFIKTRISTKSYFQAAKFINFISTFLITLLMHLVTLLVIHLFFFKITFHQVNIPVESILNMFSSNILMNLMIYILLSSLGFAVFSHFVYALQAFIKNTYLYRTMGLMSALILYTGSFLLVKLAFDLHLGIVVRIILYMTCIPNILVPGMEESVYIGQYRLVHYLGTLVLYLIVSNILFTLRERWEYASGR